jgi:aminopeptidase N
VRSLTADRRPSDQPEAESYAANTHGRRDNRLLGLLRRRGLLLGAVAATLAIAAAAPAAGGRFVNGAAGLGDRFFPLEGNGGYRVSHYSLRLHFQPRGDHLRARATIRARATENLKRFDLDFRRLRIAAVRVDGMPTGYSRHGPELRVRPRPGLRAGDRFVVRVRYAGRPQPVVDPWDERDGWVPTSDGAFVMDQPQGAPTWFPCNNSPIDKATYGFRVSVPRGRIAVANGRLVSRTRRRGWTTFDWREPQPMASYLATVTTGRFLFRRSRADGIPSYTAIDPREADARGVVRKTPRILAFFGARFGRYPFKTTGNIVDHSSPDDALETQTRPLYHARPGQGTLAHEQAHQWFGDDVSLERQSDIWLNEGFATWAEWLWQQHVGGPTVRARAHHIYTRHPARQRGIWNPPPADPQRAVHMFDDTIYNRGAMTLEALRERVGSPTFYRILRAWVSRHRFGNADTHDFIHLADHLAGRDLHHLFAVWLYRPGKPRWPSWRR